MTISYVFNIYAEFYAGVSPVSEIPMRYVTDGKEVSR